MNNEKVEKIISQIFFIATFWSAHSSLGNVRELLAAWYHTLSSTLNLFGEEATYR